MNKKRLVSNAMLVGGITEILIAVLHFLMPLQFAHTGEFAELSPEYLSFVLHGTVAIGLCLIVFGALSIYFSPKLLQGKQSAWIFGLSQGILWAGRSISELIFPVKLPLFFLSNPTVLILPLVVLLALLFLIPLALCREEFFER